MRNKVATARYNVEIMVNKVTITCFLCPKYTLLYEYRVDDKIYATNAVSNHTRKTKI